jgi:hypothetical protein
MGLVHRTAFALVLAVVAAGILPAHGQKAHPVREQTFFSEDEPFQQPSPLSGDVLMVLLNTKEVKQGLVIASDSQRSNVAELFRAAKVHLSGPDEVDLVVVGVPPMSGADNAWF